MSEIKSSIKKRNWAFVLYPESAPSDWLEQIQLSGIMSAVSPLHDKDVDPTGEPKKPHYHVILVYGSPTTYNNVKSLTDRLDQPIPQPLEQVRGYYRYLTHKDNPDKYQYNDSDIVTVNGFNIADFVEVTKSEVTEIKFILQTLIREKLFKEYSLFMDYVQDNYDRVYYDVASSHTIFFNTYIKSVRFREQQRNSSAVPSKQIIVDKDTGEVISE